MKTCQYFEVKVRQIILNFTGCLCLTVHKHYTWRGLRQTRGLRSKTKRVISQFSPHDWTTFKWEGTASFVHYFTVVLLLAVFLAAELNPFYLKVGVLAWSFPAHWPKPLQALLWMEPDHPFVIARLAGVFLCALPAVRELYEYVNDPRYVHITIIYMQSPNWQYLMSN